jgi:(p)ppGpp synthase/HD superfamily hydrolase
MKINEVNATIGNSLVHRAELVARAAHKDQKYGEQPYSVHLEDVVRRVKQITDDPEIIAAAWLHDTVEDSPEVTIDDIRKMFGTNVADMVWAVTAHGSDRAEKMSNVIEKIARTPGADFVKSADRLSNASASKAEKKMGLYNMYRDEHAALSPVLGNNALAQELVKLFND